MRMHSLLPRWRLFGALLPVLVLAIAAFSFPTFHAAGLSWWPVFIFAGPTLLSVLLSVEMQRCAIGFDDAGIYYRAVGYRVTAPWNGVELRQGGTKPTVLVSTGDRRFVSWLGFLHAVLALFMPARAGRAASATAFIPLHAFPEAATHDFMEQFAAARSVDAG